MFKRRDRTDDKSKIEARKKSRLTPTLKRKHGGFSRFSTEQIQEFQEAFNLIDQDRDGEISSRDLREFLVSVGHSPTEDEIRGMLREISVPSDLPHFLEMFSSKMECVDSEDLIRNAFSCFDQHGDGLVDLAEFREVLTTMGTRLTQQQVDEIFLNGKITAEDGKFRCDDVIRLLKYGTETD